VEERKGNAREKGKKKRAAARHLHSCSNRGGGGVFGKLILSNSDYWEGGKGRSRRREKGKGEPSPPFIVREGKGRSPSCDLTEEEERGGRDAALFHCPARKEGKRGSSSHYFREGERARKIRRDLHFIGSEEKGRGSSSFDLAKPKERGYAEKKGRRSTAYGNRKRKRTTRWQYPTTNPTKKRGRKGYSSRGAAEEKGKKSGKVVICDTGQKKRGRTRKGGKRGRIFRERKIAGYIRHEVSVQEKRGEKGDRHSTTGKEGEGERKTARLLLCGPGRDHPFFVSIIA